MKGYLKQTLSAMVDYIVPERCCLCLTLDHRGFCHQCQDLLPWIISGCSHCGTAMAIAGICGQCQRRRRSGRIYYDQIIAPFSYEDPIARQIQRIKYHRDLVYVRPLVRMLTMRISKSDDPLPDVLIPVPLHKTRLRQRGYNQATLIADELGKLLNIPVDSGLIQRVRDTPSQTDLDQAARRRNVRDAFTLNADHNYDDIAIIDDVITSGATVEAISTTLKKSGAQFVYAWSIAKT